MPDTMLQVAERERLRAELALDAHYDTCDIWPQENCPECCRLAGLAAHAARQAALLAWKKALADEARAKRNRRGQRPIPQITGICISPRTQP